jgi:hypothetical protein
MSKSVPTFHLAAKSGLIVAATAADSVLFAWRNPSTTVVQRLHRLEVRARTVTGFSAAFENALEARDVSSFAAANYTGGTDLSHPTTAANKAYSRISVDPMLKPKAETILATGNVRIATTAALAHAGAPVIASHPFLYDSFGELITADTVHKGFYDMVWDAPFVNGEFVPRAYGSDAGFVLRNPVQLGAAGTVRFWVSVIWSEQA